MSKRNWTNVQAKEPLIIAMREVGMTRQEIADELGLTKQQIKWWVSRYNRKKAALQYQRPEPKPKGRPRKDGQPPKQNIDLNNPCLYLLNQRQFFLWVCGSDGLLVNVLPENCCTINFSMLCTKEIPFSFTFRELNSSICKIRFTTSLFTEPPSLSMVTKRRYRFTSVD